MTKRSSIMLCFTSTLNNPTRLSCVGGLVFDRLRVHDVFSKSHSQRNHNSLNINARSVSGVGNDQNGRYNINATTTLTD